MKITYLSLIFVIGFISCKNSEKEINKLSIAENYYSTLNNSDYSAITGLGDSITTEEGNYKQAYSKKDYIEFLEWDSVFNPTYEILDIEQKDGVIEVKVSKIDKRISFLQKEPFLTNQTIKFQKDKIISIETNYVNFDGETWGKNVNKLVNWIKNNHPELNGFIHDQTEQGALKYLKAIELFKNKKLEPL